MSDNQTNDLGPMTTVPFDPDKARERAWIGITTSTIPVPKGRMGKGVR